MLELHVGKFPAHLDRDLAPEAGGLEDVGLVDGRHELAAAAGEGEGEADDAADFVLGVDEGVHGALALGRLRPALGLAEVEAAGELADDEEVHAGHALGLERGEAGEGGDGGDGAEIGVEAEGLADAEEALLGADLGVGVVPLGSADGPEQHGIGLLAGGEGGVGEGGAVGVDGAAAEELGGEGERVLVAAGHFLEHEPGFGDDLGADAVAGEEDDVGLHGCGKGERGGPERQDAAEADLRRRVGAALGLRRAAGLVGTLVARANS